jgi:hypothetical protein
LDEYFCTTRSQGVLERDVHDLVRGGNGERAVVGGGELGDLDEELEHWLANTVDGGLGLELGRGDVVKLEAVPVVVDLLDVLVERVAPPAVDELAVRALEANQVSVECS